MIFLNPKFKDKGRVHMNSDKMIKNGVISSENLDKVFEYVESIRFGTVTLIIQNGKVVQIEKNEKIKLN